MHAAVGLWRLVLSYLDLQTESLSRIFWSFHLQLDLDSLISRPTSYQCNLPKDRRVQVPCKHTTCLLPTLPKILFIYFSLLHQLLHFQSHHVDHQA